MLRYLGNRKRGFTLIELAIVLSIAGLLFVGLWRLLAGGNQQVRDQSAAAQQVQLISAVKGYLASNQAVSDNFINALAANPPGTASTLALPGTNTSNAICRTSLGANNPGFCDFLPAGFTSGSVNSYGQTYSIKVQRNDSSTAGTVPSTYSFMILSLGGDTIPDTSGGRISAAIGNDGGFVYANQVCAAPTNQMACGSYGTWQQNITNYGFAATSGHIATRTYVSPTADNLAPWLARPLMAGDNATAPVFNTMLTDFFLGGKTLWLGSNNTAATGGNTVAAVNMQGGVISGAGTSQISMTADNTTGVASMIKATTTGVTTCPMTAPSLPVTCPYAISTDSINVSNLVNAFAFYAFNFNYTASDIRFKTNIRPIGDGLENVMKLKPVTYTLKTTGKENMGIIAQDLEKVYPDLVAGSDDKYVSYDGLIAPMIGAIQQLKHENDLLRQELKAQEQRENALEKKIRLSQPDGAATRE